MARLFCVFGLLTAAASFGISQITIINSGSTNVPGLSVKLEKTRPEAMVELRDGSQQKITLTKNLRSRLTEDLKAAGPLNELPTPHCMKSVSFGTSLFIEEKGVRSPDLNCPQMDPRLAALKRDALDIMAAAKTHASAAAKSGPPVIQ